MLRRTLEEWFDSQDLRPKVVGELDDPALAEVLAKAGVGVFAVPDVVAEQLRELHKLQIVAQVEDLRQRFYAISVERKIRNPAVVAICEAARKNIFA